MSDRKEWLSLQGRTEGDVLEDEEGEFVYSENEDGTYEKIYLPDELRLENL